MRDKKKIILQEVRNVLNDLSILVQEFEINFASRLNPEEYIIFKLNVPSQTEREIVLHYVFNVGLIEESNLHCILIKLLEYDCEWNCKKKLHIIHVFKGYTMDSIFH